VEVDGDYELARVDRVREETKRGSEGRRMGTSGDREG
jgi:hypothetical protein